MSSKIIPAIAENWLKIGLVGVVLLGLVAVEAFAQTTQPAAASQPVMITHEQWVKQVSKEPLIKEDYQAGGKPLSEEQLVEVAKANASMESAWQARSDGRYTEAVAACDKALATYQQILGQDHHRTVTAAWFSRALAAFKSDSPEDQKKLASADAMEKAARAAHEAGNYRDAMKTAQQALQIRESVLGKGHAENVVLLRMIGNEQTELGLLSDAEVSLNQALDLSTATFGPRHPNTAFVLDRLGWLRINQGKSEEAVQALSRAVRIFRAATGETADLAEPLDNLGTALVGVRDPDRALLSKLRAYVIRQQLLGPEHRDTAVSLSNLAWLYAQTGSMDPQEITSLRRQALAVFEKTLGPEHAWTFLETANLARQYVAQGELDEGIKLYEKMIQSDRADPNGLDQRAVDRVINLGALYLGAGRHDEALRLLNRASELNRELHAKGDIDAAISQQDNLTSVYQNWRMYEAAAQAGESALAWAQKTAKRQDDVALSRLVRLGTIYKALGRLEDAKRVLQEVVRQVGADSSKEPLRPVNAQLMLASVYERLGQLDEAERTCNQALQVTESNLPRKARGQAYPLLTMGRIQRLQKNYEMARFSLEEAVAIFEREENRRIDPASLVDALLELAACRLAEGEKSQAAELCRQAVSQIREIVSRGRNVNATALLIDALKGLSDALKTDLPAAQKEYEASRDELKKLLTELRDVQALSAEHKQWLTDLESGKDKD